MKNIVFVFFNGGGLTYDQWYTHPYADMEDFSINNKTTDLIEKIKTLGDVFLHTPKFYTKSLLTIEDFDISNYCKSIYDKVFEYDKIFVISHSRGWIISDFFIELFGSKIIGYINIDGGESKSKISSRVNDWSEKYDHLTNNDLKKMHDDNEFDKISRCAKYHVYKQYRDHILIDFNMPTYILNNIYNDGAINIHDKEYVETTLGDKILFNDQYKLNSNVKSTWYIGNTHFLYFDFSDDIYDISKKIIDNQKKENTQIVLFGDLFAERKSWFYDTDGQKIDFIKQLEKIAEVIILEPTYLNFMKFLNNTTVHNADQSSSGSSITYQFTKEDLQYENFTSWAYSQLNPNKKYIVVGVDQGCHFAKYFANYYKDSCIGLFILGDRILTKENYEKTFLSEKAINFVKSVVDDNWEKFFYPNVTNEIILELLNKIQNEKPSKEYVQLLNGICKGIVRKQYDKINNLQINSHIYKDVKTITPEIMDFNNEFNKSSNDKIKYYYIDYNERYMHIASIHKM